MAEPTTTRNVVVAIAAAIAMLLISEGAVRLLAGGLAKPPQWSQGLTDLKARRLSTASGRQHADAVFAGASQTLTAFDPSLVDRAAGGGLRTYNGALLAAVPSISQQWLRDTVLPKKRPKLVMLGLTPLDFLDTGPTLTRGLALWRAAQATRPGALGAADRWAAAHFDLVRYRTALRSPGDVLRAGVRVARNEPTPVVPDIARNIPVLTQAGWFNAFVNVTFAPSPGATEEVRQRLLPAGTTRSAAQVVALRDTVRMLRARHIRVVIVSMPVTDTVVNLYPGGGANAPYAQMLRALAGDLHVPFYDLDRAIHINELFADQTHLNGAGASVASIAVGSELSRWIQGADAGSATADVLAVLRRVTDPSGTAVRPKLDAELAHRAIESATSRASTS